MSLKETAVKTALNVAEKIPATTVEAHAGEAIMDADKRKGDEKIAAIEKENKERAALAEKEALEISKLRKAEEDSKHQELVDAMKGSGGGNSGGGGVPPATPRTRRTRKGINVGQWFVVALILFFHILDWKMGYVNAWNMVYIFYVILALIMAFIAFFRSRTQFIAFFKYLARYLLICAIGAIIPRAIKFAVDYMPGKVRDFAFFLLLLFPVILMIYTFDPLLEASDGLRKFMAFWMALWLFIFTIVALFSVTLPVGTFNSAETELSAQNSLEFLRDGFDNAWEKVHFNWQQSINVSKWDPFYYTGRVEQNKDRPLGVKLEGAQASDPYFVPGSAPTIWSYVTAETFLSDSIFVEPYCTIDRRNHYNDKPYPDAVADPLQLEVFRGHSELFECRFPGTFKKGSYPVEVSATFDFSTWGDITYEFVLEEKIRDYARLQKNVNTELKIPVEPAAIFTNGPVMIGMGGSRLPVAVISEEPYLKNAYLGFTLQNRWANGKLNEVQFLELKVPHGFTLSECDRRDGKVIGPSQDPNVPEYDRYIFENVAGPAVPFTSVRCKLGLESPDVLEDLYLGSDKALRTFIASTNYRYTITDRTTFEVRE